MKDCTIGKEFHSRRFFQRRSEIGDLGSTLSNVNVSVVVGGFEWEVVFSGCIRNVHKLRFFVQGVG
jgi:hypothetical protein